MAERRLINPANWPYFDHSKMPYSLAAEKDGILFLSGQTAERENPETGKIECTGDAVEQMDVIMEKHKLLIEASGGKPEDMTNRTVFTSAAGSPPLSHYKRAFRSSPTVTPEMWRSNFGPNYAPGTGLYMQGNLNLNAIWSVDLVLDIKPGEKRYINPGFPPSPEKSIASYESGTNRPGVFKNDILWSAGQAPWYIDEDNERACPWSLVEQTRYLFEKFDMILAEGGVTREDVIMTRDYIIPAARPFYRLTADLRREFFGEAFPASTGVVCLALNAPEWMIEINMVAVKGGKKETVLAERAHAQGITFLPGVKKGNLFFISGTTGHHPETGALAIGDVEAQTRQTYQNIAEVLEAGGASFKDVLKVTDYIDEAALPNYHKAIDVRREFFGSELPAASTTVCNRLLDPQALIEVEAIAVIG